MYLEANSKHLEANVTCVSLECIYTLILHIITKSENGSLDGFLLFLFASHHLLHIQAWTLSLSI